MAVKSKISPPKRVISKSVKGSGGFKARKKFSWKKAVLFAFPIAIIGGFLFLKATPTQKSGFLVVNRAQVAHLA